MRILSIIILMLSSLMATPLHSGSSYFATSILANTSPYIKEYPLPTLQAVPGPIAVAPNGTIWFAETNASSLAKFDPSTKSFTEFPFRKSLTFVLPSNATQSIISVATDSQGNVWFTLASANAFGYFNATNQAFTYYNLTLLTGRNNNFPYGITIDPTGAAWVAENLASRIGRLDFSNGTFREYSLLEPNQPHTSPVEIFVDNNHKLWITSYWYNSTGNLGVSGSTLTRFDPTLGQITRQYNLSEVGIFAPVGVVVDQKGRAWIGDHAGSWMGEVNTMTGEVRLLRTSLTPLNPNPQNLTDRVFYGDPFTLVNDVVLGNDGTPWFIEHIGARVGHYIPSNDTVVEYNIPTQTPITRWLAVDQTGGLWFTEEVGNKLGFLDTKNAVPPFETMPPGIDTLLVPGASTTFTLSVKNLSPNPVKIMAGVENTLGLYGFTGPLTNVTVPGQASTQVTVQMSASSSLPPGNYTTGALARFAPIIKITDGNVNYPIPILAVVTSSPFNPAVLLYAAAGTLIAIALTTGAMFLYNKKRNSPHTNSN